MYFIRDFLDACNGNKSVQEFLKKFNNKKGIWLAAQVWEDATRDTLTHASHYLMPTSIYLDRTLANSTINQMFIQSQTQPILPYHNSKKIIKLSIQNFITFDVTIINRFITFIKIKLPLWECELHELPYQLYC